MENATVYYLRNKFDDSFYPECNGTPKAFTNPFRAEAFRCNEICNPDFYEVVGATPIGNIEQKIT